MSKNPTNFSRDFIKTAVEYNIAEPTKLRDYDILKDHQKGLSYQQIATKYGLSRKGTIEIVARYAK